MQSGTVSNNSETPTTHTINAVIPENSILIHQGFNQTGNTQEVYFAAYVTLTNATTLTLTRSASGGSTVFIQWTVIEFLPGVIKSVQAGVISVVGSTTGTATITQVDPLKCMLFHLGFLNSSGTGNSGLWATRLVLLVTGLGVRVDVFTANTFSCAWRLVEFF